MLSGYHLAYILVIEFAVILRVIGKMYQNTPFHTIPILCGSVQITGG